MVDSRFEVLQGTDFWASGWYDETSNRFLHGSGSERVRGDTSTQCVDYGRFYASKSFLSADGRRVIIGSVHTDGGPLREWNGMQSAPRTVTVDHAFRGRLLFWPIRELDELRTGPHVTIGWTALRAHSSVAVGTVRGPLLDILAIFGDWWHSDELSSFGLSVLGGAANATITIDPRRPRYMGRRWATLQLGSHRGDFPLLEAPVVPSNPSSDRSALSLTTTPPLSLRLLVDHGIVEAFTSDGRAAITEWVWEQPASLSQAIAESASSDVAVINAGPTDVALVRLEAHTMRRAKPMMPPPKENDRAVAVSASDARPKTKPALVLRPGYHYTRRSGWMNDGIPTYDPRHKLFHLFHICDPNSTRAPWAGGKQAWCHATSADMAKEWTTRSVALPPESPGTGSAIMLPVGSVASRQLGNASAVILTACVAPWTPVLWASYDDTSTTWRRVGELKLPPPKGSSVINSADVHLGYDMRRSAWRLVLSGISTVGAPPVLLHYETHGRMSASLLPGDWRYSGVLFTGPPGPNRLECPGYVPLADGRAVLTYSFPHRGYTQHWVSGDMDEASGDFQPRRSGQLEVGVGYAAGMTAAWPDRLLLFSWMRGVSDGHTYVGAQSLPREVRLLADGSVAIAPADELRSLLKSPTFRERVKISGDGAREEKNGAVALTALVPQQSCVRLDGHVDGSGFPATVGLTLRNDGGVSENDEAAAASQLELVVEVSDQGACALLHPRPAGCAAIGMPLLHASLHGEERPWTFSWNATLFLDNGLVEVYVNGGLAVLSAFEPSLVDLAGGAALNGSVWVGGERPNVTASFVLEWNEVASAEFHGGV